MYLWRVGATVPPAAAQLCSSPRSASFVSGGDDDERRTTSFNMKFHTLVDISNGEWPKWQRGRRAGRRGEGRGG